MVDFGASGLASCATTLRLDDGHVEAGRLFEREEVVANPRPERKVGRILQLLEEEFGGGEALPEDDT
jgi:hypothetical protein